MDLAQRISEDLGGLWRQVGNLTRAVTVFDVRFDRVDGDIATLKADVAMLKTDMSVLKADVAELKTDVAVLKADVAELKTDVAATKEQLNRLERATENRFNRVDAQLDRLVALIQRDEVKN
jgi:chromosome segregation ATPase